MKPRFMLTKKLILSRKRQTRGKEERNDCIHHILRKVREICILRASIVIRPSSFISYDGTVPEFHYPLLRLSDIVGMGGYNHRGPAKADTFQDGEDFMAVLVKAA